MLTYDENKKCIRTFQGHGLLLFARKFMVGDTWEVPSHVRTPGQTVTISILPTGSIRTYNTSRAEHLDIEGGPGLIFGGLMLPGTYTLEGLEDNTEYVCVTRHLYGAPPDVQYLKDDWDYQLENATIEGTESVELVQAEKTNIVICLWGEVMVTSNLNGPTYIGAGEGYVLQENEEIVMTRHAGEFAEVAWTIPI